MECCQTTSVLMRRFSPLVLCCLLPLGCSQRGETTSQAAVTGVAGPVPSSRIGAPPSRSRPSTEQVAAPALVSSDSSDSKTSAQRTAAEIVGHYTIFLPSPDVLIVRRTDIKMQAPSLFEESIALASVRSKLKSSADFSPSVSEKARLSNGTAIVPFEGTTSPDRAADVITRLLAVNGVQSVRAVFSATP